MTPTEFFNTYYEHALRNEMNSGVPALFTLAQCALETGWAKHAPGNMMFGIKATGWSGAKQLLTTREVLARPDAKFPVVISVTKRADGLYDYVVKDYFRAYDSPYHSFADHAAMLRSNKRYASAFETKDPREFARRIAAAGYATDPRYAASLIKIIDQLEEYARIYPKPAPPKKHWLVDLIDKFLGK